jgi:hypothetical protein
VTAAGNTVHDHHRRLFHGDHMGGQHGGGGHNGGALHFTPKGKNGGYSNYVSAQGGSGLVGYGGQSYSSIYSGDNQHSDSDQESYV